MAKKRSFLRRVANCVFGRDNRTGRAPSMRPRRLVIDSLQSRSWCPRRLVIDPLESRTLLTALVYAPNGPYSGWSTSQSDLDWSTNANGLGGYTYWSNTDEADFLLAGVPQVVPISDSVAQGLV